MTGHAVGRLPAFAALGMAALLLSHELVYLLAHGPGDGYRQAMSDRGHGGYWASFVLTVVLIGGALVAVTARQLIRLTRQARSARSGVAVPEGHPIELLRQTLRLGLVITAAATAAFVLQENIELAAAAQQWPLLEVVSGPHAMAVPVIGIVSTAIAFVAALCRWRRALLIARLGSQPQRRHRTLALIPAPTMSALRASALLAAPDGRAPPTVIRPSN